MGEWDWEPVDCLELIDLDFSMVVQLVERQSVSRSQPVDYLEAAGYLDPADWLPLAEQDLVSCSQLVG